MDFLQSILHLAQAGLSAYSLYHAYISITNLRQYEEKSEKAAEWSATVEHELHKTRTTQTFVECSPGMQVSANSKHLREVHKDGRTSLPSIPKQVISSIQ